MKKLLYIALIATALHQNISTGAAQLYNYAPLGIPAFSKAKTVIVNNQAYDLNNTDMKSFNVSNQGKSLVGYNKGTRVENAKLADVVALLSDEDGSKAAFSISTYQSYTLAGGGRISDIVRSGSLTDPRISYTSYNKVMGDQQK